MKNNTTLVRQHVLWRGLYFLSVLLINIGIARYFAAEKSGQIFYLINYLALILLIVSFSLESGATYYIASGKIGPSVMAGFCLRWALAASVIALFIWWLMLRMVHSQYIYDPLFIFSGLLFMLGVLLTTYFTALFYAQKIFALPNRILFMVNLIFLGLLALGRDNPYFRTHFISIYFFSFFSQGVLLSIYFSKTEKPEGSTISGSGPVIRQIIKYSLTALLANLVYFLVNRIDYWFVQFYCSPADLGNYIQASKLAQMMFILPGILGATLFPIFASSEKNRNTASLISSIRILLWINGLLCLVITGLGWFIFPKLFGLSFNHMYMLFLYLIPGVLSVTANYPLAAWFSANNRIAVNIRGSMMALLVICAGDLILLPRFGIRCASLVSSAGFITYFSYSLFIFQKKYKVSWKSLFLIRKSDLQYFRNSITTHSAT